MKIPGLYNVQWTKLLQFFSFTKNVLVTNLEKKNCQMQTKIQIGIQKPNVN